MPPCPRLLLIDPAESARGVLAERLELQGFRVAHCSDGAQGAVLALEDPPAAVIANLTMPSISGVQLCRLLGSEQGTSNVPVILRGDEDGRSRFWAEQAGAFAFVPKGRMGELVRALRRAIKERKSDEGFFFVCSTEGLDVRERIAEHLDAALFDSVVAAEVRSLGASESFDRLTDLLSQFVSQVTSYRWLAVLRREPLRLGLHTSPAARAQSLSEAQAVFGLAPDTPLVVIEDDDATAHAEETEPLQAAVHFGDEVLGSFALAPRVSEQKGDRALVATVARELGGALRMATLLEESRFMATTDALTGLLNRRSLLESTLREVARTRRYGDQLSVILLDIDHFKHINDERGHAAGDLVLAAVGRLLQAALRTCDIVARWGGEEFVLVLPSTSLEAGTQAAERVRALLANAEITDGTGKAIPVSASFGVASYVADETLGQVIDRADRAMYRAKSSGRNCVVCDTPTTPAPVSAAEQPTPERSF
jgi:diguanylate cyclase (GGDEF)-like protein